MLQHFSVLITFKDKFCLKASLHAEEHIEEL